MTVSRRRLTATGVALALALSLGACTSESDGDSGGDASMSVEGSAPLTVKDTATWSVEVLEGAPVRVTPLGVLTFSAEKSVPGEKYSPMLLSPDDGSVRWDGEPIESEEMPALYWVEQGNAKWAVAKTAQGNSASLYSWDGLASHADTPIASSSSFDGKKKPPSVAVTASGVLVTGADKTSPDPLIYWPKSAALTRYKGDLKRDGKAGKPISAYGDGFLIEFPKGGFSLATDAGGWSSEDVAPGGANPKTGKIVAQGSGYLVAEWVTPDDEKDVSHILSVHSASTGQARAQYEVPEGVETTLADQTDDGAPLVADGSRWLTWGQIGFNLRDGDGAVYNLSEGTPTAIIDGMLYAKGAYSPLAAPGETTTPESEAASAPPEESGEGGEEATVDPDAPDGFAGVVGVDLRTSQPMAGLPSMYPIGRAPNGQVILRDDAKHAVYAVSLR